MNLWWDATWSRVQTPPAPFPWHVSLTLPLLPGAVPRSSPGEECAAGETSRALLQAQDPPEVGGGHFWQIGEVDDPTLLFAVLTVTHVSFHLQTQCLFCQISLELDTCLLSTPKMRLTVSATLGLGFTDCWITSQTSMIYLRPSYPWLRWVHV